MPKFGFTEFSQKYATEEACIEHLVKIRWNGSPVCPACGSLTNWKLERSRYWECKDCHKQFSITDGTAMEHTRLPLTIWFQAIFLMATSSKGVSAMVLSRQLGVGYKTAWFLAHRVRNMLKETAKLEGIVEADETYISGKKRKTVSKRDNDDDQPTGRGGSKRTMVITAVERDGRAKAKRGDTHSGKTIAKTLYSWVNTNAVLATDELPAYRWIGRRFSAHLRINHSKDEWVRKDPFAVACAHTNTVEGFNSTIKRAIMGVFHWWSIKHCDRYLLEISTRWDMRKLSAMERFDCVLEGIFHEPLPWAELVAV